MEIMNSVIDRAKTAALVWLSGVVCFALGSLFGVDVVGEPTQEPRTNISLEGIQLPSPPEILPEPEEEDLYVPPPPAVKKPYVEPVPPPEPYLAEPGVKQSHFKVVMYSAPWCGPCQRWKKDEKPKLTTTIEIKSYQKNGPSFIKAWPTFMLYQEKDGKMVEIKTWVGAVPAKVIDDLVNSKVKP